MILTMDGSLRVQTVHQGKLLAIELLSWVDEQGQKIHREVVRHPGAVVIVPLLGQKRVVLIKNHRIAVDDALWELPAGTREKDEDPITTAARELEEETGYKAGRIEAIGKFFTSPGFCDELIHVFVACDLEFVGQRLEAHEKIEVHDLSWANTLAMIDDGTICDCKTIAALLMVQRRDKANQQ